MLSATLERRPCGRGVGGWRPELSHNIAYLFEPTQQSERRVSGAVRRMLGSIQLPTIVNHDSPASYTSELIAVTVASMVSGMEYKCVRHIEYN